MTPFLVNYVVHTAGTLRIRIESQDVAMNINSWPTVGIVCTIHVVIGIFYHRLKDAGTGSRLVCKRVESYIMTGYCCHLVGNTSFNNVIQFKTSARTCKSSRQTAQTLRPTEFRFGTETDQIIGFVRV